MYEKTLCPEAIALNAYSQVKMTLHQRSYGENVVDSIIRILHYVYVVAAVKYSYP